MKTPDQETVVYLQFHLDILHMLINLFEALFENRAEARLLVSCSTGLRETDSKSGKEFHWFTVGRSVLVADWLDHCLPVGWSLG